MTENLWLNLHDGHIGSGRQNWDGSGGTGAALKHFQETGQKYPLCVKLGTITADIGKADVYSYDPSEDCMVQDPFLKRHLMNFGLDVEKMQKTDKTLLELELDLNEQHIFSQITENEKQLKPCFGPEFVGLRNLGNTCYMNSVLQVLFKLDVFQKRFLYGPSPEIRKLRSEVFAKVGKEPQKDAEFQLFKLSSALSDPFSEENSLKLNDIDNTLSITPKLLKETFCGAHPEFKKKSQQDSEEFFQYFLTKLGELNASGGNDNELRPEESFSFVTEERLHCSQSNMLRYKQVTAEVLPLNIPISIFELNKVIEANKNQSQKANAVELPTIEWNSCLDVSLGNSEKAKMVVTDYLSPATGQKGIAYQTTGMKSFPKNLCVQLRRYVMSDLDYSVHKLTVLVPAPTELDLSSYASFGPTADEVLLPEDRSTQNNASAQYVANLAALTGMGFPLNVCKHALLRNDNNVDLSVNWIFENMNDPQFALAPEVEVKQDEVQSPDLMKAKVEKVLKINNGSSKYKLRAFISHIGSNTASGHYVCHVFDDKMQKWVIFNDEKVALSEDPPLAHGYLYFYERQD